MGNSQRGDTIIKNKQATFTPGPGNYNSTPVGNKTGFKFSKDEKLKQSKNTTPGPGNYYIPVSIVNAPGFAGGKFDHKFKFV
jgi:hypothetical protein